MLNELAPIPDRLTAIRRGFVHLCPRCGHGCLYRALLKFSERCGACGEVLGNIRTDDGPAWLTILVVGHIVVPGLVIGVREDAPTWLALGGAIAASLILTTLLLPSLKGAIGALLWSLDMPSGVPESHNLP